MDLKGGPIGKSTYPRRIFVIVHNGRQKDRSEAKT